MSGKAVRDHWETRAFLKISFVQRILTGMIQLNTIRKYRGGPSSDYENASTEDREQRGSNQHPRASTTMVIRKVWMTQEGDVEMS